MVEANQEVHRDHIGSPEVLLCINSWPDTKSELSLRHKFTRAWFLTNYENVVSNNVEREKTELDINHTHPERTSIITV